MSTLSSSELILNPDGSIYHLHLRPEQLCDTIITVGDPDRVSQVIAHFDSITFDQQRREFRTAAGTYKGIPLMVISTGIGTDNIDIVFNELDALANIDFESRQLKTTHKTLRFVRIGTSGAMQPNIPVDSWLLSSYAIGMDNLLHFYQSETVRVNALEQALQMHLKNATVRPYAVAADFAFAKALDSDQLLKGITMTNAGFYGPQGRSLRIPPALPDFIARLQGFGYPTEQKSHPLHITNLEMETSGIYGMAKLLGHQAVSLNAILANRVLGQFSKRPKEVVDGLITLHTR